MRSHAYSSIDHTNNGIRVQVMPGVRRLWIVTMKLIALASADAVTKRTARTQ